MAYDKNSIVHDITLLYVSFAQLTDGKTTPEEIAKIAEHAFTWMDALELDLTGDGKVDADDLNKLIFADVIPYFNAMDNDSRLLSIVETATMLQSQEWWNDEVSVGFLDQIKDIALADGKYHENEKKWIQSLAEIFDVDYNA